MIHDQKAGFKSTPTTTNNHSFVITISYWVYLQLSLQIILQRTGAMFGRIPPSSCRSCISNQLPPLHSRSSNHTPRTCRTFHNLVHRWLKPSWFETNLVPWVLVTQFVNSSNNTSHRWLSMAYKSPNTSTNASSLPIELSPFPYQRSKSTLSYSVSRTKSNQLPVYETTKHGGNLAITTISHVRGDIRMLSKALQKHLELPNTAITIKSDIDKIIVRGRHKVVIKEFLEERQLWEVFWFHGNFIQAISGHDQLQQWSICLVCGWHSCVGMNHPQNITFCPFSTCYRKDVQKGLLFPVYLIDQDVGYLLPLRVQFNFDTLFISWYQQKRRLCIDAFWSIYIHSNHLHFVLSFQMSSIVHEATRRRYIVCVIGYELLDFDQGTYLVVT